MTRVLAVDPGEKRLGLAISDPGGNIANPLKILTHISRMIDAASVAEVACDIGAEIIIIGQALDSDGLVGPMARKAIRFADAVRGQTSIPVYLWDESGSTQTAIAARIAIKGKTRIKKEYIDSLAATVILQSYLDTRGQMIQ